jgi:hypothetical protein
MKNIIIFFISLRLLIGIGLVGTGIYMWFDGGKILKEETPVIVTINGKVNKSNMVKYRRKSKSESMVGAGILAIGTYLLDREITIVKKKF